MPGVSNNNPLIRATNLAAAERGNTPRGTPPIKTLEQTQATSPAVPNGVNNGQNETEKGVSAGTDPGVGAQDDGTTQGIQDQIKAINGSPATAQATAGTFDTNSRRQIVPRGNVLDRFSSYTYKIGVYLMSPEQYTQLVLSRKKNINSYNLLFQSGGAATGQRNPAFDVDFYIDSVTLNNLIQGKSTGSAHGVSDIKFTVVEPYGITLIDRIYEAVQQFAPADAAGKGINYGNSHYLMVIRWYGYDSEGNIITAGAADPKTGLTDPNAVVEKFIPFMINSINFSVATKGVTYEFDCTATNQLVSAGSRRGQVPYDIQLGATTVKDLLDGQATTTTSTRSNQTDQNQSDAETRRLQAANAAAAPQAPAKANAAAQAKNVITGGLMAALTQYQKTLTEGARPVFDQYDEYHIEFTPRAKAIAEASLVIPGSKQEAKTAETKPPPNKVAGSANPDTDSKDNKTKTKSIYAGQPIVQVIDQIIRNSTYITGQQLTQINDDGEEIPNPEARNKPVNWFSISFRAEPKQYDFLRNDYAYKITYIIDVYTLDKYDSKYFPIGTFRGVHKSYPWWFTGQNTAIIDYSETLNTAFNMLVSGTTPENSAAETQRKKIAASMREIVTYVYGPGSEESRQGAESKTFEGAANLADSLYGGADLADSKLRIIGDPAWIQQGSLIGGTSVEELENSSFLPDGTINFDGEQPMYEVQWNRPADYNLETGLQTPNSNRTQMSVSRVYMAGTVTSEFRQGKFEQIISGLLYTLPKPDGSNKAPTAPMPVPTQREPAAPAEPVTKEVNGHLVTNVRKPGSTTKPGESAAIVYRKMPVRAITVPVVDLSATNTSSTSPSTANNVSGNNQTTTDVQPQNAPTPPTSNGGVAGTNSFTAPPTVGGRGRIQVPNNPQLLAKDQ